MEDHDTRGFDSTDSDSVVISTAITHNTDRANACVNSEVLPYITLKTSFGNFFTRRIASDSRTVSSFSSVISPITRMASPGPGNGWRQTTSSGIPISVPRARTSSLKEGIKWFNQFKLHVFWKTTNVVVRFDCLSCLST